MSHPGPSLPIAIINAAVGVPLLAYGLWTWTRARATYSWPNVRGKVLGTHVTSITTRRGGTTYYSHVLYEYTVDGRVFRCGRRLMGGEIPHSKEDAEALCSTYPAGDAVWVYYNPADPADAVLEHSESAAWRWALLGAVFCGFAIELALRRST